MSTDRTQPDALPNGLSEDQVLSWIECELTNDLHEVVGRSIDSDPALAKRLRAMRADREAVRAMPIVQAPEGLLESVEATMERHALLGLADGVELASSPPMSVTGNVRRPLREVFSPRSTPVRLAAAASVLLMVGGAAYTGIWMLTRPGPNPTGPVAITNPDTQGDEGNQSGSNIETVSTDDEGESLKPPYVEDSIHLAWMESLGPSELIEPDRMGLDEALRLAADNRLVVHVTSKNVNRALRDLGQLAVGEHAGSDQWRLSADVPQRITDLLSPGEPILGPFEMADRDGGDPRAILDIDRPAQTGVYMADARLTSESLEALLSELDADGRIAEFSALEEPIELGERPLSLDEIIWWTSSPADWSMWTRVPVVFEPER